MGTIREPEIFARLAGARRVLVAGAGGGFDVFAGLPLGLALRDAGKQVFFANLTFTYLGGTDAVPFFPHCYEVTPQTRGEDKYFPERALARFLNEPVWAFEKVGARPLTAAYRALAARLDLDAVVLVDGGTDILMFGDEAGLGTPHEDMTSLFAAHALGLPLAFVACIGFGIDSFHGVCHAHFLENVATLERDGAYLGAFSVPRSSREGAAFLEAIDRAQQATTRLSIVNGQIAAALRGEFGDVQFTERTAGSELFVNPLMGLYFTFDLAGLARRSLYLPRLAHTETVFDVGLEIEGFREETSFRKRRSIPG